MEKDLIEYIAKSLVDNPTGVSVNEFPTENGVTLELHVNESDVGKVIGKHGRIAKAMRTLLNAVSTRNGQRVNLEIME
ncbi:MAG: KH domain-containing protein [Spirochaetes bacterium]|uniref:RNA-binding protein KhpA n=1 Tax=Candidatus Gallitreponema excrementavium TaxID=2840840 RepID=A0A9D9HP38_9SPIR|nr:KH domain-containing protein [Candidatus Gallitreponema excrementavium]